MADFTTAMGMLGDYPPFLYDKNGYIRNSLLDKILDPSKIVNDTLPPAKEVPWWMPQDRTVTQDKMPTGPRSGFDRLRQPIVQPPAAPMPQLDYIQGPGLLKVVDQQPKDNMNWLDKLLNSWQEGARAPRPQGYDPRKYSPKYYENYQPGEQQYFYPGIPGVNGEQVPNPNPPHHTFGSGVRG